ncbi:hypothetical protein QUB63_00235 [Microcoleus sp. ARI1-B5]
MNSLLLICPDRGDALNQFFLVTAEDTSQKRFKYRINPKQGANKTFVASS